jgi:hypothetical protein
MTPEAPTTNGSAPPALGNGKTDGIVNVGPPTVMHLIRQEMVRRAKERKPETEDNPWPSWNGESENLAQWAKDNITNGLRVPVASTIRRDEGRFYDKLKSGWLPEHAGN